MAGISIKKLTIKIDGDEAGLRKAAKAAEADIKGVKKTAENISSTASIIANKFGALTGNNLQGTTSQLNAVSGAIGAIPGPAGLAVGALTVATGAAVALGVGLFGLAKNASDAGSKLYDAQQITGLTAETLSTLDLNAQASGSSLEQVTGATEKFAKLIGQAKDGSVEAQKTLKELGVTSDDLDTALDQVTKTIFNAKDGTDQITLSQKAFGKSGGDLIPVIKQMGGDLKAATAEAERLGLTLSQADIEAADAFGDSLTTLQAEVTATASKFALQFAPAITQAMDSATEFIAANQDTVIAWGTAIGETISGINAAIHYGVIGWNSDLVQFGVKIADIATQLSGLGLLLDAARMGMGAVRELGKDFGVNDSQGAGASGTARSVGSRIPTGAIKGRGSGGGKSRELTLEEQQIKAKTAAEKQWAAAIGSGFQERARQIEQLQENTKNFTELAKLREKYKEGFPTFTDAKTVEEDLKWFKKIEAASKQFQGFLENNKTTLSDIDDLTKSGNIWESFAPESQRALIDHATAGTAAELQQQWSKDMAEMSKQSAQAILNAEEQLVLADARTDSDKEGIATKYSLLRLEAELLSKGYSEQQIQDATLQFYDDQIKLSEKLNQLAEKQQQSETIKKLDDSMKSLGVTIGAPKFKSDLELFNELLSSPLITAEIEKRARALNITTEAYKELARQQAEAHDGVGDTRKRRTTDPEKKDKSSWDAFGGSFLNREDSVLYQGLDAAGDAIYDFAGAWTAAGDIANQAMTGMAQGIGSLVQNWVLYGDAAGGSLRKIAAQVLASAAMQATVLTVMETAYGIAALTPWGAAVYGPAPMHFQAALLFGSIAAGTALIGRAVAGNSLSGNKTHTPPRVGAGGNPDGSNSDPFRSFFGQRAGAVVDSLQPAISVRSGGAVVTGDERTELQAG